MSEWPFQRRLPWMINKHGGAYALRIPHDYFYNAGLKDGDLFDVRSERGHDGVLRLIIEPVIKVIDKE